MVKREEKDAYIPEGKAGGVAEFNTTQRSRLQGQDRVILNSIWISQKYQKGRVASFPHGPYYGFIVWQKPVWSTHSEPKVSMHTSSLPCPLHGLSPEDILAQMLV